MDSGGLGGWPLAGEDPSEGLMGEESQSLEVLPFDGGCTLSPGGAPRLGEGG